MLAIRPQEASGLIIDGVFKEEIVLAAAVNNRNKPENIEDIPLVFDHRDSGLYIFLKNELMTNGIDIEELNIKAFAGTTADKLVLLKNSDNFCFVPKWFAEQVVDIKPVCFEMSLIREFYEIYQKSRQHKVESIRQVISQIDNCSSL